MITTKRTGIDIEIISVPEFAQLTKQYGSYSAITLQTKGNQPGDILAEYHEFIDIFETKSVEKLPDHGHYDLKINLEPGATVTSKSHYPASPEE